MVKKHGPNVKRLIAARMAAIANPRDVKDGLLFLSDAKLIAKTAREAEKFACEAIATMRLAAEPNPWKHASDEEIAGKILREAEKIAGEFAALKRGLSDNDKEPQQPS